MTGLAYVSPHWVRTTQCLYVTILSAWNGYLCSEIVSYICAFKIKLIDWLITLSKKISLPPRTHFFTFSNRHIRHTRLIICINIQNFTYIEVGVSQNPTPPWVLIQLFFSRRTHSFPLSLPPTTHFYTFFTSYNWLNTCINQSHFRHFQVGGSKFGHPTYFFQGEVGGSRFEVEGFNPPGKSDPESVTSDFIFCGNSCLIRFFLTFHLYYLPEMFQIIFLCKRCPKPPYRSTYNAFAVF